MIRERVAGLTLMLAACVHQASAQDTYVSASLTGDIVRFSGSEPVGVVDVNDGGEAIGFALRVGTRLGPAWGVEAELARAGEIEHEAATGRFPVPLDRISIAAPFPEPLIFPPIAYRVRTSYRNTIFSAAVWARQDFSVRVALGYTGGVGFHRSQREVELTVDRVGSVPGLPGAPELADSAALAVGDGRRLSTAPARSRVSKYESACPIASSSFRAYVCTPWRAACSCGRRLDWEVF